MSVPTTALAAQADKALRRALAEPTLAEQVLIVTARVLRMQPTSRLTPLSLTAALHTGQHAVLATVPAIAAEDARRLIGDALPQSVIGDTNGEYALRLQRQAAR